MLAGSSRNAGVLARLVGGLDEAGDAAQAFEGGGQDGKCESRRARQRHPRKHLVGPLHRTDYGAGEKEAQRVIALRSSRFSGQSYGFSILSPGRIRFVASMMRP